MTTVDDVRRIVSFDVESNGLHGESFAIGGIVIDMHGRVEPGSEILLRCPMVGPLNEYVATNVLPALSDVPETHENACAMRGAFGEWLGSRYWYHGVPRGSTIAAVDCGMPVEARMLLEWIDGAEPDSQNLLPYPLYDVVTLLLAVGVDPDISREEYAAPLLRRRTPRKHDPLWDAEVSALCAVRVLRGLRRPRSL